MVSINHPLEDFLASATTRSVNENYIKFRTYLEEVMENKIHSKLSSKRFKLPWFNRELKCLCRKRLENIRRQNVLEEKIIGSSIKNLKK